MWSHVFTRQNGVLSLTLMSCYRKLVSAACILLAAKISSDLKKQEVKHLIDVRHTHTHTHSSIMVVISASPSDHVALAQVFVKLIYLSRWKTTCRTVSVLTQLNIKPQQGCCHSGQTGSVAQQLLLAQHLQRGSLNLFITQLQLQKVPYKQYNLIIIIILQLCSFCDTFLLLTKTAASRWTSLLQGKL